MIGWEYKPGGFLVNQKVTGTGLSGKATQDFTTASDSQLMYSDPNKTVFSNVPGVNGNVNMTGLKDYYSLARTPGWLWGANGTADLISGLGQNTRTSGNLFDSAPQYQAPGANNVTGDSRGDYKPNNTQPTATSQGNGQWSGMYQPMGYESWMPIRPTNSVPTSTFMPGAK